MALQSSILQNKIANILTKKDMALTAYVKLFEMCIKTFLGVFVFDAELVNSLM